jgi:hypothetical protein
VEIVRRWFDFPNGHIAGQMGVQGILQFLQIVQPVEVESSHLPAGVGAGISASGQVDCLSMPTEFSQGFFELTLRCTGTRLPLTPEEAGAIVSEDNLVTCHFGMQKSEG